MDAGNGYAKIGSADMYGVMVANESVETLNAPGHQPNTKPYDPPCRPDGVESDFRVGGLLGVEPRESARKILDCQSSDAVTCIPNRTV